MTMRVENAARTTPRMAPLPWGTSILNKMYLLSPVTWVGALQVMATPSSSRPALNLEAFVHGWLSILVPLVVLSIVASIHNALSTGAGIGTTRLILSSVVSPWTMGCLHDMKPDFRVIGASCRAWKVLRLSPLEDAVRTLNDRIQQNRAYRTRRYDVYLPQKINGKGLILLPGAMVSHQAYSEVAAKLSDYGLVIVVVSVEPLRLASLSQPRDLKRILAEVNKSLPVPVTEWSLGGHSMGGYAAMRLTPHINPHNLVVWAAGSMEAWRTDLREENCRTLILEASCDAFCQFTRQTRKEFRMTLPQRTTIKLIRGGNHGGFASYPTTPFYDGIAKIPRHRQHELACSETAAFLLRDT